MRSFFSWFWDHKIMRLLHFEIMGSRVFQISRSQDHKFSSFWDHGITSNAHFEITGSRVFSCWDHGISCFFVLDHKKSRHTDHKIIGISKIKIIRSQYFFDPEKLDHKIMDHKYDPQFYDLIFDFTTVQNLTRGRIFCMLSSYPNLPQRG